MYQNCCKKCGSIDLFTDKKGNNTGLYCRDCGAWIKWLGKDELRAFIESMRPATKEEQESIQKHLDKISVPTGTNFYDDKTKNDTQVLQELKDQIEHYICHENHLAEISADNGVMEAVHYAKASQLKDVLNWIEAIKNGRGYYD